MDGETCLTNTGLAGVIFGCIGATLFSGIGVAVLLYYLCVRHEKDDKQSAVGPTAAYENRQFVHDVEMQTQTPEKTRSRAKVTQTSPSPVRRSTIETMKSSGSLNMITKSTSVINLNSKHSSGLGFSVQGGINKGIFVGDIVPSSVAKDLLNSGDRIVSCQVDFSSIALEDAMTILSYASPYSVQLRVDRGAGSGHDHMDLAGTTHQSPHKTHPLLRAQSTDRMNERALLPQKPQPVQQHHKRIQSDRTPMVTTVDSQTTQSRGSDAPTQTSTIVSTHHSTEMTPPPEVFTEDKTTQQWSPTMEDEEVQVTLVNGKVDMVDRGTSLSPYAHLTPDERLQILRLSYEDATVTQSTPHLDADPEISPRPTTDVIRTPSPDFGSVENVDDDGSLPDVDAMKTSLYLAKTAAAQHVEATLPCESGNRTETRATTSATLSTSTSVDTTTSSHRSHPYTPKLPPDTPAAPNIYRKMKTNLNSTMTENNWLRPTHSEQNTSMSSVDRTKRSTSPNITVSAPDAQRAQSILTSDKTGVERVQQEKLLYYQAQLARQQEELAAMGIHIPRPSLSTEKGGHGTAKGSASLDKPHAQVIMQHRQQF